MRVGQINGFLHQRNGRKQHVAQKGGDIHGAMRWTFLESVIVWLIAPSTFASREFPVGRESVRVTRLCGQRLGMGIG